MDPKHPGAGSRLTPARIAEAVSSQLPYMVEQLSAFVAAASPSGAEQPAAAFMESAFGALGLASERIHLNSDALKGLPLYSPPCCADGGRYNLLAVHEPQR